MILLIYITTETILRLYGGKKGIEVSSYNPKDNSVLVESGSLVVTCDSFERRSK